MYKNVLIPTLMDNEAGLETSVAAARLLLTEGGQITLLNVVEEIPIYVEAYVPNEVLDGNLTDAQTALDAVAAKMGGGVKAKVVKGHAGRTILAQANEMETDLIVISSHRPELSDYFLGSTAGYAVRHAACPVLVLR